MTIETEEPVNNAIIIDKILEKNKKIIDRLEKKDSSENLQQIANWIKQFKSESLLRTDIAILAVIIDTVYFYFKSKFSREKQILIEGYLNFIINNFNHLPNEEILTFISSLKKYIYTADENDKSELENFMIKNTSKIKKIGLRRRVKPQIIEFDAKGKGFVANKKRKIFRNEIVNQANTHININQMYHKIISRYDNETQLTKDIREAVILRSILSKEKIGFQYERSIEIIFQSIALEEFKEAIRKKIYDFKIQDPNITLSVYKESKVFFQLPKFSDIKNKYLDNFLLTINYSNLEKLMKKAQIVSDNIYTLIPMLDDIKNFYCEWGINYDLFKNFYIEIDNFSRTFSKKSIANYLEKMICLIEEKKLKLDENNFDRAYQISDVCIKNLAENSVIEKINKLKLDLSIENFLNLQKKSIKKYLDNYFFQVRLDGYPNKRTNISLFKSFLIKMKELILNFFSISFFINNINNLEFLASKFDVSNLDRMLFERIHNKFILKVKWWHFLSYRMNPLFLVSVSFKKKLSEQLLLYIVNYKFTQIVRLFDINEFPIENRASGGIKKNIECVDTLFLIQSILKDAKIGNTKDLTNFYGSQNNIFFPKSRKQIAELLKRPETFIDLSKMISTLNENIEPLMQEFFKLLDKTLENMKKLEENQEKNNLLLSHVTKGKSLFQLPKTIRVEDIAPKTITLKA